MRPTLPALLLGLGLLAGCVAYPVAPDPAPVSYGPSTCDRADDAALGALVDQGLRISNQNRATGQITSTRGNASLTAAVRPQRDGTTRVEFKTSGDSEPGLSQRVLAVYNARMGR